MILRVVGALCAALLAVHAPPAAAQPSAARSGAGLTLLHALQSAVASNPRLTSAERAIAMADGRRVQAGALPNPTLGVEVDNFGSGQNGVVGGAEFTLQVSQLFELGGKRDARVQAALGDYDAARWEREATKLELLSETAIAFVEAMSSQRRIQILDRQVGALEKLVPLMQRRVEAGASSPAEVSRMQAAVGMARLDRERARLALAVARRELATLMGSDAPNFGSVVGNFGLIARPAPLESAIRAIDDNPQLMRWTAVRAQRDASLLSARLKPLPDITAGLALRHYAETNENAVRLGVSIPINVLDRNTGAIREAQELARRTEAERAMNRLTLVATVAKAHDAATAALAQVDLLRRLILPAARSALQKVEEGYGQGRFTLLEILDAYRTVFDAELLEHETLASFHTAVATIEGLTGSPLHLARTR
ncbi:TolC family protein [Reyranella sp.]|uniref:TolC family protein n=1 Tax=Reyranella sp. TaxID=1929291 RepID=UPI003BAD3A6F